MTLEYMLGTTRHVQRLIVPSGSKSHRVYGGANLGFTPAQWDVVETAFVPDYMGAAEYECGRLPRMLYTMFEERRTLVGFSFVLPKRSIRPNSTRRMQRERAQFKEREVARRAGRKPIPVPRLFGRTDRRIYVLCTQQARAAVAERVRLLAKGKLFLREASLFEDALDSDDTAKDRICGWAEIDNGFLFFTDEVMWRATGTLFAMGADVYGELHAVELLTPSPARVGSGT